MKLKAGCLSFVKKKKNQDHCFLGMQKDDDSKDLRNACLVTELTKLHNVV